MRQSATIELTRIQKLIGSRMSLSKKEIPCFYLQKKINLLPLSKFRKGPCRQNAVRAGTNDFIIKALADAVEKFPLFAGKIDDKHIKIASSVNVGFAVDSPQGLMQPVIKNANNMSISEISNTSRTLMQKARSNTLGLDELSGSCISLSSLAMFSLTDFIAINPPGQTAILAIGKILDEIELINNKVQKKKSMILTLTVDHRIINGSYAARFLSYIANWLENPQKMVTISQQDNQ